MPALPFVSAPSANAILSDLRPTTLTPSTLDYVNLFLDELLVSLITAAHSINPVHLRTRGVPAVFNLDRDRDGGFEHALHSHSSVGSLGHSAVGEAELEIRGWYDVHPTARKGVSGFPPGGTGCGLAAGASGSGSKKTTSSSSSSDTAASAAAFPVDQAIELMRVKVSMFSTFAPNPPSQDVVNEIIEIWKSVGGDVAEETIAPAGLWITAILEHVSEHILTKLSQVVARDSSVTAAGIQDLYTALCEDVSVYGFFQHMSVRNKLESEIHTETKRRRPQRTASTSGVSQVTSPAGGPSSTSVGSPHSSKTSLASTTHGDPRKSTNSRPSSEGYFKGTPKGSSSSNATHSNSHRRTPSVLSISTKQASATTDSTDPFAKRFSSDKAEEDFDAFLRSGETMRVSLTPSRFSTFESSPTSSPSRLNPLDQQPPRSSGLSSQPSLSQPSLSQSSLLSTSTQGSMADSNRTSVNYRQAAGRSWSSVSKMMPRNAAIEEKEEENADRPSVLELIKQESPPGKQPNGQIVRTVPAVILGSPPSSPNPDSPHALPSDLPPRITSLNVTNANSVPISEPSDSPRMSPQALPRAIRSASEGAPDLPPSNGTFRRNVLRSERVEAHQETREMAAFFSSSGPPKPPPVHVEEHGTRPGGKQHRMSSFKSLMSLMKKDKAKDPERRPLNKTASAQTLRSPTPSDQGPQRTQKSSISSASGSTVMGLSNALAVDSRRVVSPSPEPSPHPSVSPSPVKPREVLRKPSLVRKWALSVTAPSSDQRNARRSGSATSRSVSSSPLPQVLSDEDADELESTPSQHHPLVNGSTPPATATSAETHNLPSASNRSDSSHQRPGSPSRGLGLGGIDFPDSFIFRSEGDGDGENEDQGPEAALAQLTASSKSSSPVLGNDSSPRDSPRSSPKLAELRHSPRPPLRDTSLRSSPLHQRVLELAREGDDNPASIPPPIASPSPSSPEISSGLGTAVLPAAPTVPASVDGSLGGTEFMSANGDMDDDEPEHEHDVPETEAETRTAETPDLVIRTPEMDAEGDDADRVVQAEADADEERDTEATVAGGSPADTDDPSSATIGPEGLIPVSDLVPLRHLLDHATSARECQILLDAILTQLGVPRAGPEGAALPIPAPEDRVVAWLLAGREGPVGDASADGVRRPIHMRAVSTPVLGGGRGGRYQRPLSPEITMKTLPALPPAGALDGEVAATAAKDKLVRRGTTLA